MPIYKVDLIIPHTEYSSAVSNSLPSLTMTIGSSVQLSDIGLMQFVRIATKEFVESNKKVTIYALENQNIWNCYQLQPRLGESEVTVLEMKILGEVETPEQWHYVADPLKTMGYIRLVPYEESLNENSRSFYFDWQLPNIYLQQATDYDHDVQATGSVVLNSLTGELEFSFIDCCKEVACLSEFPEVVSTFKQMIENGLLER